MLILEILASYFIEALAQDSLLEYHIVNENILCLGKENQSWPRVTRVKISVA